MQNPLNAKGVPGALGLGQSKATIIYYAFFFLCYTSPVAFAIISDTGLGCYKTLWLGLVLYICGCLILVLTSLPIALQAGAGVGGFAAAAILIALGVGGVKSTVSPFIGQSVLLSLISHVRSQIITQLINTQMYEQESRRLARERKWLRIGL
jgi:POT family proton-dependent oligopeptide transporter